MSKKGGAPSLLSARESRQLEHFRALLTKVFSAPTRAYARESAFAAEYDAAIRVVVSTLGGALLEKLMGCYLELYGRHRTNAVAVGFHRSDQLFTLLVEQSGRVADELVFERWAKPLEEVPPSAPNSFGKRKAELRGFWARRIEIFIKEQRAERRQSRSLLDVLRDAYTRQHGAPPKSNDVLYDFDPRPHVKELVNAKFIDVRGKWEAYKTLAKSKRATTADLKKQMDAFAAAVAVFDVFVRDLGQSDLLSLFQAVKVLQFAPRGMGLERRFLYNGLYVIACVRLWALAASGPRFSANRFGFTEEEQAYFGNAERIDFYYASNFLRIIRDRGGKPRELYSEAVALLQTYLVAVSELSDLRLLALDKTLALHARWDAITDLLAAASGAARDQNASELERLGKEKRWADTLGDMKTMRLRSFEVTSGTESSRKLLRPGSTIGEHSKFGPVRLLDIDLDYGLYVELAVLRPWVFWIPRSKVADLVWGKWFSEIHAATIGMAHLTELIFKAMGFMPALISGGIWGLVYEIASDWVGGKLADQLAKIDPTLGTLFGLAFSLVTPNPDFRRRVKEPKPEEVEAAGGTRSDDWSHADDAVGGPSRSNTADAARRGNGVDDLARTGSNAAGGARRAAHVADDAEVDDLINRVRVEDELTQQFAGFPLRMRDIERYLEPFKGRRAGIPTEWREIIKSSKAVRDLIRAALDSPQGYARLARIGKKQRKLLPWQYQVSSMGSEFELHIRLDGVEYKLDGVIVANGKSYIGESKMTYYDLYETADNPMASFHPPKGPEGRKGWQDPAEAWHFRDLKERVAQMRRYDALARRFGFDGVALMTNTDFMWQTFEQVMRRLKAVEVLWHQNVRQAATMATRGVSAGARATARKRK